MLNDVEKVNTEAESVPIGDDTEIADLQKLIGEVAMQSMLEIAPDSFLQQLQDLQHGLRNGDSRLVLEASHALKGAASALYTYRLAAEAAHIEKNSKDLALVESVMPSLEQTVDQTIEWLRKKQA